MSDVTKELLVSVVLVTIAFGLPWVVSLTACWYLGV